MAGAHLLVTNASNYATSNLKNFASFWFSGLVACYAWPFSINAVFRNSFSTTKHKGDKDSDNDELTIP
jgi:hypothetical protein